MDEKERPITDKENFPKDSADVSMVLPSIAYADGCADGYRKAMLDIMLWSLALLVVSMIVGQIQTRS